MTTAPRKSEIGVPPIELDELLDAELQGGEAYDADVFTTKTGFNITDMGTAEWAMRRLTESLDDIDVLETQAAVWKAEIVDWLESRSRRAQATIDLMSSALEAYVLRVRTESEGKVKSVVLPSGKVGTTVSAPAIEVVDKDLFFEWIDAQEDRDFDFMSTEVVRKIALVDMRKTFTIDTIDDELVVIDPETGERITAGVQVKPEKITAKATPKK